LPTEVEHQGTTVRPQCAPGPGAAVKWVFKRMWEVGAARDWQLKDEYTRSLRPHPNAA